MAAIDSPDGHPRFRLTHAWLGHYTLAVETLADGPVTGPEVMFCNNETNDAALYGSEYWEIVDNIEAWLNQNEDEACNLSDYFIETINEFLDNKGFGKYKPDAEQCGKIKEKVDAILKA